MNKIKNWTYLYKEILQKFSQEIEDVCILQNNKINNMDNEVIVTYISPEIAYNKEMHKNIGKKELLYVTYSNLEERYIENNKRINILNIGEKYVLNIFLKKSTCSKKLMYMAINIGMLISDIVIVNKINNIDKGILELDIALELGKDIYAIPGDIFDYKNYLANYAIKQGAIPICSKYDIQYILQEKKINVL